MFVLLSDHGFHMNGLLAVLGLQNVEIERRLPTMMIKANKKDLSKSEIIKYKINIISMH